MCGCKYTAHTLALLDGPALCWCVCVWWKVDRLSTKAGYRHLSMMHMPNARNVCTEIVMYSVGIEFAFGDLCCMCRVEPPNFAKKYLVFPIYRIIDYSTNENEQTFFNTNHFPSLFPKRFLEKYLRHFETSFLVKWFDKVHCG